jgi:predicted LPLAT superfamily acyltransferase
VKVEFRALLAARIDWNEAAARASEKALAKLRALRPPPSHRTRLSQIHALMERQTDVLYQTAAAASTDDTVRFRKLSELRIRLTHQKDGLVVRLSSLWGISPDTLQRCPVGLPA